MPLVGGFGAFGARASGYSILIRHLIDDGELIRLLTTRTALFHSMLIFERFDGLGYKLVVIS